MKRSNIYSQEITKLREQSEKQKRSMKKLEEKLDQSSGKKRFNPADAFTHAKKENMPLSVISNGKYRILATKFIKDLSSKDHLKILSGQLCPIKITF